MRKFTLAVLLLLPLGLNAQSTGPDTTTNAYQPPTINMQPAGSWQTITLGPNVRVPMYRITDKTRNTTGGVMTAGQSQCLWAAGDAGSAVFGTGTGYGQNWSPSGRYFLINNGTRLCILDVVTGKFVNADAGAGTTYSQANQGGAKAKWYSTIDDCTYFGTDSNGSVRKITWPNCPTDWSGNATETVLKSTFVGVTCGPTTVSAFFTANGVPFIGVTGGDRYFWKIPNLTDGTNKGELVWDRVTDTTACKRHVDIYSTPWNESYASAFRAAPYNNVIFAGFENASPCAVPGDTGGAILMLDTSLNLVSTVYFSPCPAASPFGGSMPVHAGPTVALDGTPLFDGEGAVSNNTAALLRKVSDGSTVANMLVGNSQYEHIGDAACPECAPGMFLITTHASGGSSCGKVTYAAYDCELATVLYTSSGTLVSRRRWFNTYTDGNNFVKQAKTTCNKWRNPNVCIFSSSADKYVSPAETATDLYMAYLWDLLAP